MILRDAYGKFLKFGFSGVIRHGTGSGGTGKYHIEVKGADGDYIAAVSEGQSSVSEAQDKNFPNSTSTRGWVRANGNAVTGNLNPAGDVNGLKVRLYSGFSYQIDVKGNNASGHGGTLGDPVVTLVNRGGFKIDDASSVAPTNVALDPVAGILNDNGGKGNNARLEIDADVTGTYTMSVYIPKQQRLAHTLSPSLWR